MKENNAKPKEKSNFITKPLHDGHRERMRERFLKNSFDGMQDHEILEMLLFNSVYRKNTNNIAHALIETFGSLRGVLEAPIDQLVVVKGVSQNSAVMINMMLPIFNRYRVEVSEKRKINTVDECGNYLCDYYSGITNERVMVICLDNACKVLSIEPVGEGGLENCVLNCRRLVEVVLKYPTTSAVIIAHNHPDGLALPSKEDVTSTVELIKMMKTMSINVIDHFIIAGDEYVSLASSSNFKNIFRADR